MNKRLRVFFSGTVQGVGFRYAAKTAAGGYAITGWVRNLSDGRVEILAEGTDEELKSFVEDVEDRMSGYIEKKRMTWESASGEWDSFQVAPTE